MGLGYVQHDEPLAGLGGSYSDTLNRALRDMLSKSGYNPDATTFPGLLGPVFNVKAYGALGGGTADATTGIQAALNAARDAGGGVVSFPDDTYLAGDLVVYSGTRLVGSGVLTHIKKKTGASYLFSVNPGTGGTTSVSGNQKNISFAGLWLEGLSATIHNEFQYLLNLNAVSDVLVERCIFTSFEGDAIYLGSSNVAHTERHNERVTIRKCVFDGVNNNGRNGVSIIDGAHVLVEDNYFTRTSYTGMPGGVDIEPNTGDAFAIIRDIVVRHNHFDGLTNGAAVNIALPAQSTLTVPASGIRVLGNHIINCPAGLGVNSASAGITDSTVPHAIEFSGNFVRACGQPFGIDGVRGIRMLNNDFVDCTTAANLGYTTGNTNMDIVYEKNTMLRCGTTDANQSGLIVRAVDNLRIERNKFIDCGLSSGAGGRAILFSGANTGTRVFLRHNIFSAPTGKTTYVIGVNGGYTLVPGTSVDEGNVYTFATNNDFVAHGSKVAAAPSTGTWTVGNVVYNSATPGTPGQPLGWVCTAAPTTFAPTGWVQGASANNGDASVTLTATSAPTQRFDSTLTANRTVTLPSNSTSAKGQKFRIVRTGSGAFTLTVQDAAPTTLKAMPASTAAYVDVEFNGTSWQLAGYGTL